MSDPGRVCFEVMPPGPMPGIAEWGRGSKRGRGLFLRVPRPGQYPGVYCFRARRSIQQYQTEVKINGNSSTKPSNHEGITAHRRTQVLALERRCVIESRRICQHSSGRRSPMRGVAKNKRPPCVTQTKRAGDVSFLDSLHHIQYYKSDGAF